MCVWLGVDVTHAARAAVRRVNAGPLACKIVYGGLVLSQVERLLIGVVAGVGAGCGAHVGMRAVPDTNFAMGGWGRLKLFLPRGLG